MITKIKYFILISTLITSFYSIAQVPRKEQKDIRGDVGDDITIESPIRESGTTTRANYYQLHGKYGFVYPENNRQEAIYDEIRPIYDNYIIKKNGLYGFADKNGILKGKIDLDSIGFNESQTGDTYIVKKNGKYGTISKDDKTILSIKYNQILFCSSENKVSFVKDKDGQVQMIFNQQEKLFPKKIQFAEVYSNLAILKVDGKFGVVKVQTIIPFDYDSIFVSTKVRNIDKIKTQTNPFTFNSYKFNKTINCLTVKNNEKYGLIDSDGNTIYNTDNDIISNEEGYRYYTIKKDNLFGIYFTDSKKKTEIAFDQVYSDGVGYAMAVKNKKAGVFNLNGEQIIPFEYDATFIAKYQFGLMVTKNKKKGVIDFKGNTIIPTLYDGIDSFYESGFNGFIKVKNGEKIGIIDIKGNVIIPAEYEWIGIERNLFKVATAEPDRKFGLYDKSGKVIVTAKYRWITNSDAEKSNIIILVKGDNEFNFLNEKNQLIFAENIAQYGYILNQNMLLNPFSDTGKYLMYVQNKGKKFGLLNERTGILDVPMVYDEIKQRFESGTRTYFSIKKGKKYGLIDDKNKAIIPINYDAIHLDLVDIDFKNDFEKNYSIVVSKLGKYGTTNLKNEVKIPLIYTDLQRLSSTGLYKAKTGKYYQIINSKNQIISKGPFDEVSNFEIAEQATTKDKIDYQALTFNNGKMKVINDDGKFESREIEMAPHKGYKTFNELKFALVKALDSENDVLLKDFSQKIAPSKHIMFYLKQNIFDRNPLDYSNIEYIKEKYFNDISSFKHRYWNNKERYGYNKASLTQVNDYTFEKEYIVTNSRFADHAYGDKFMEKLLRNAIKVNGFWISSYFMIRNFDSYQP